MKDGYPAFREWVLNGDKTTIEILAESGAATSFPNKFDFRYEEQWLTPEAKEGMEMYTEYLQPQVPTLSYEEHEEERFNKIMIDVRTYVDEYTQKWIFGSENVEDTFDAYLEQLKKLGIDEATEIQQNAYKRYLKLINE